MIEPQYDKKKKKKKKKKWHVHPAKTQISLGTDAPADLSFRWMHRGARWLSGRVSDSGARGPGFETYLRRVVSLSKTLYSPKVLVNYPGSDGSVPT